MKRTILYYIKIIALAALLILGFFIIKNNFIAKPIIAIIHNNQPVNNLQYALGYVDIIEVDTDYFDTTDIDWIIDKADGVVFAGGNDFDPSYYGGTSALVEQYSREDDQRSFEILDMWVKKNKPVLGICRGLQLINLYYGGSLYDDLASQYGTEISHRGPSKTFTIHGVNIAYDSKLGQLIDEEWIEVNSLHHQAIKDLGDGLVVSARASDGVVEAIENPYYPYMIAVQWHPEYDTDFYSQKIFDDFAKYCKDH